jgi:predicted nucleic acid-binding protein
MRLYLDSSAIIYSIEGMPQFRDAAVRWIERVESEGQLLTSQLARLECRVKPMRDGNAEILARFDALFSSPNLIVRHIDTGIIDRATQIRAEHGFRTPDAIHLATAIAESADVFLTGDDALARFTQLRIVVLEPYELPQ